MDTLEDDVTYDDGTGYDDVGEEDNDGEIDPDVWEDVCWHVIDSYFEEKGLVRQQLDSFNEFIDLSIQQIVKDTPSMKLDCLSQHLSNEKDDGYQMEIKFDQIYLSKPVHDEEDGVSMAMMPNFARLRGLTYWSPLYVDVKETKTYPDGGEDDMIYERLFIGKVPIMLRSTYCSLNELSGEELMYHQECDLETYAINARFLTKPTACPSGVSAGQIMPQCVLCSCRGFAILPDRSTGEFNLRK
eukprot:gene16207-22381_t